MGQSQEEINRVMARIRKNAVSKGALNTADDETPVQYLKSDTPTPEDDWREKFKLCD
jgi:hypothetical protein